MNKTTIKTALIALAAVAIAYRIDPVKKLVTGESGGFFG